MYKISRYNYFLELEDVVVYFNGITGVLFPLKKQEHIRIQSFFDDCISFEINYPSVFDKFVQWGFFIDVGIDEVDIIRLRNKREVFDDRNYHLILNPTLECNFNCWYCYENHVKGKMSSTTIDKIKNHIDYVVNQKKYQHFIWHGLEESLCYILMKSFIRCHYMQEKFVKTYCFQPKLLQMRI